MAVSTDNSTSGTGSQSSTVSQTNRGMKQAYRVASAAQNNPVIRNQRSPQRDPNNFTKDLNSIAKSLGSVATDTYALNDSLVDEMASSDTSELVTQLDSMEKNLMPGDDRHEVMHEAANLRAGLIANKDNFGGNEDMKARYQKKFANTSAVQVSSFIKDRQKEQYKIDYNKLDEEFTAYKTNIFPKLLATHGDNSEIIADANETVDKYIADLARYGEQSATAHRLSFAKEMTDSFNADINGNIEMYISASDQALINVSTGKVNGENVAKLWNKKYFYYGTMDDSMKITYRIHDASVNDEISKQMKQFKTRLNTARASFTKQHESDYKVMYKSLSTKGYRDGNKNFGLDLEGQPVTGAVKYESDVTYRKQVASAIFQKKYGYKPTDSMIMWASGEENVSNVQQIADNAYDKAVNDIYSPISDADATVLDSKGDLKEATTVRAAQYMVEFNNNPAGTMDILKQDKFRREKDVFVKNINNKIFSNPTTNDAYTSYKQYRKIIEDPALNPDMFSGKDGNKNRMYIAIFKDWENKNPNDEFKLESEDVIAINNVLEGRMPKKYNEYINSVSLSKSINEASENMTPSEAESFGQISKYFAYKASISGEDVDLAIGDSYSSQRYNGDDVSFGSIKTTTVDGAKSDIFERLNNIRDKKKAEKGISEVDNFMRFVLEEVSLLDNGDKKSANMERGNFVVEDIGGGEATIYMKRNGLPMYKTGIIVNIRKYDTKKIYKYTSDRGFSSLGDFGQTIDFLKNREDDKANIYK